MRTELENRLRERYPQLFRRLRVDPTCPLGRGIEVEDGWFGLLDQLCERIARQAGSELAEPPTFLQVKQKFGVLRAYVSPPSDTVRALIAEATEASRTVCEWCGSPEATLVTRTGCLRTLCVRCATAFR